MRLLGKEIVVYSSDSLRCVIGLPCSMYRVDRQTLAYRGRATAYQIEPRLNTNCLKINIQEQARTFAIQKSINIFFFIQFLAKQGHFQGQTTRNRERLREKQVPLALSPLILARITRRHRDWQFLATELLTGCH